MSTRMRTLASKALPRRTLLKGTLAGFGSVALALPVLDAMLDDTGTALAQTGLSLPKRFGSWFFGGGVVRSDEFFPETPGSAWQPTEMLQPLAELNDYLTLVRGPAMGPIKGNGGHWHHRGYALSNSYYTKEEKGWPGDPPEPSIDQIAAEHFKGKTRFDSVQLGILDNGINGSASWKADHQIMRPETDPKQLFVRLFEGDLPMNDVDLEALRAARSSVLDANVQSAKSLASRLGASDRQRIEAHLEGIRNLERRLQMDAPAACERPSEPTVGSTGGKDSGDFEAINEALVEVLVTALACDLTRVFSFMFSGAQDKTVFRQLDISEEYHARTHENEWYYKNGPRVVRFIMQHLAVLAERLRSTPEGVGNLLDRTLIYATTEFQDAAKHSRDDHPFILIGRAGGSISGGRYIKTPGAGEGLDQAPSLGSVMLSALRAVDVPVPSIGSQQHSPELFTDQPLAGILV